MRQRGQNDLERREDADIDCWFPEHDGGIYCIDEVNALMSSSNNPNSERTEGLIIESHVRRPGWPLCAAAADASARAALRGFATLRRAFGRNLARGAVRYVRELRATRRVGWRARARGVGAPLRWRPRVAFARAVLDLDPHGLVAAASRLRPRAHSPFPRGAAHVPGRSHEYT